MTEPLPKSNPGCGVTRAFYEQDHLCQCWSPLCTGFDHVCPCGEYWRGTVRTRFLSFDSRGQAAGDPCKTRMRVRSENWGQRYRVFEIAQFGQRVSRHGDIYLTTWLDAMDYALWCIDNDERAQREYLNERAERMHG